MMLYRSSDDDDHDDDEKVAEEKADVLVAVKCLLTVGGAGLRL
jgi:hypothetical protein